MSDMKQAISAAEQILAQTNSLVLTLDPGSTEQAAALTARDAVNGLCTVFWTMRNKA